MKMNTNVLPLKALLAVLPAVTLLPIGLLAACIAFTITGTLAVLLGDYGRKLEPVRAEVTRVSRRAGEGCSALPLAA